jgi:hypothetical protein
MERTWKRGLLIIVVVGAAVAAGAQVAQGDDDGDGPLRIRGGATTMLEGGTGGPNFTPVLTKLAFHWDGETGDLECLALAPSAAAGQAGSGNFDTNIMYVTGPVTSAQVTGATAVLEGTATVTGVGAGEDQPFRLIVRRGGPGTTVVLEVSGLVFKEIVLEGQVSFS